MSAGMDCRKAFQLIDDIYKIDNHTYMMGDETRQRSDFGKHSDLQAKRNTIKNLIESMYAFSIYLIYLFHHSVQYLAFERPKYNGLILDRIHDESLTGLNDSRTDHVDGGDGNDESVFAGTSALHLSVQFLFDRLH